MVSKKSIKKHERKVKVQAVKPSRKVLRGKPKEEISRIMKNATKRGKVESEQAKKKGGKIIIGGGMIKGHTNTGAKVPRRNNPKPKIIHTKGAPGLPIRGDKQKHLQNVREMEERQERKRRKK